MNHWVRIQEFQHIMKCKVLLFSNNNNVSKKFNILGLTLYSEENKN